MPAFSHHLAHHPDITFAARVLSYLTEGARIGYTGPRAPRCKPNWPSFYDHIDAARDCIDRDVAHGAKAGPYAHPPFATFVGSPMGAFLKRHSNKLRVIHDLSYPAGSSVNDFIEPADYTVQYGSFDSFVERLSLLGPGALMAKLDLENAYRQVLVHPDDWDLLGSSITVKGETHYYVDTTLPFGLRSAPLIFNEVADALAFIMRRLGITFVDHYLDDFFTLGPPDSPVCADNRQVMLDACRITGFPVSPSPGKVTEPAPVMELLGLIIDTVCGEIRISAQRLKDTLQELSEFSLPRSVKKRRLLSLIGKLAFISKVVRSGRTFTRRLIEAARSTRHLHHHVYLTAACREDIVWWRTYLPSWNGVSFFMDSTWTSSPDLRLASDASNLGLGITFQEDWCCIPFDAPPWDTARNLDIAWRELLAVVVALATFGPRLAGKRVLLDCDNQAIVSAINEGTIRSPSIMCLVRALFF
ncbi:MAG: reverse transcriptase domain-containing protein, partial [Dehalococcoidia bacterium]